MLGGFPYISKVDLQGSRNFLAKLGIGSKSGLRTVSRALEGGAGSPLLTHFFTPWSLFLPLKPGPLTVLYIGATPLPPRPKSPSHVPMLTLAPSIGRITEGFLLDVAEQVDIVEPIAKFTAALLEKPGVGSVFNIGLEEWQPLEGTTYDLVWNQWCLGHLTDDQLVDYMRRCKQVVAPNDGLIVVKENLSTSGVDLFDDVDSSVTRVDEKFRALFEQAGLRLIKTELQRGFPKELFPVRMYALK
ncbi:alpha N-terminal protein methyltransferase 1 [Colletotrichum spaethianum]|uniref:Alpha N-terminal protein methyltransferase 1 n=1 Tax=Colletotrichum spaethianum TaxID=700344 RepID=A0AA37P944_9PEZI|nr:alpha N-terminal protein methyltransferase 1 [Colletotrichum spaethianum]GKT47905.1 alpha N-terminal protein methyltransferase 1 [Colletotrichum spaethianum]